MPFAVAAAGVTAAAGIAGSYMQSQAIKSGQSQANQAIQQGVQTATNQLSPWTTTGVPANQQESDLLGLNGQPAADAAMSTYQQSPGYQWQLGQGLRAVDAGAASQGMLRSGATLKAEQTFGQRLADTDFGNYWNRLQQLSGNGLSAAGGIASAATGGATQIASTDTSAAAAQAKIDSNTASSIGSSVNGLMNNQGFQNWVTGGSVGAAPSMTGFSASHAARPGGCWRLCRAHAAELLIRTGTEQCPSSQQAIQAHRSRTRTSYSTRRRGSRGKRSSRTSSGCRASRCSSLRLTTSRWGVLRLGCWQNRT